MMHQGGSGAGAGFGMVARAALMPTPTNGVNGNGGHHPPPHPHHPVSLGLEVRFDGRLRKGFLLSRNPSNGVNWLVKRPIC